MLEPLTTSLPPALICVAEAYPYTPTVCDAPLPTNVRFARPLVTISDAPPASTVPTVVPPCTSTSVPAAAAVPDATPPLTINVPLLNCVP